MFKKTRLRIFGLIMAVATVIITLLLSVIYIANANYSFERGISLLESYIENENNAGRPQPDHEFKPEPKGNRPDMKENHNKMFRLSTFYSVFYNQNGEAIRINCDNEILYSEEDILEITNDILASGKTQGTSKKMPFLVKTDSNGTIVAMIDNTMEKDNSDRLFLYCLITGICGWFIILILSWLFSKKIVNPLEANDAKQKQFISDAGHELKTPISVISANADLLSLEIGENKWLSNIQYENERMGDLVKQLLELVRAENMQQAKEKLDFSRLVSGGALPFESVAFEKGLVLNTEIEDGIFINGNQSQLSQLVSILIDNAITHGTNEKDVSVKLTSAKHYAVLSVVNSGQPISDEIKDRLFERFYRADESRKDDAGHYGLGLAIAKAIITAHGGKIELNCVDGLIEFKAIIPKI